MIEKQKRVSRCPISPMKEGEEIAKHIATIFSVKCLSNGKPVWKELPGAFLGYIPKEIDPFDLESDSIPSSPSQEQNVGEVANHRDLANALFAPHSHFTTGEIVLVPRSSGGFTYGKILGSSPLKCPAVPPGSSGHTINDGWRVGLSLTSNAHKDLMASCLGKIHLMPPTQPTPPPSKSNVPMKQSLNRNSGKQSRNRTKRNNERKSPSPRQMEPDVDEEQYEIVDNGLTESTSSMNLNDDDEIEDEVVLWNKPASAPEIPVASPNPPNVSIPSTPNPPSANTASPLTSSNGKGSDDNASVESMGGILNIKKAELLKSLMTPKKLTKTKHLIVIDGPNVATVRLSSSHLDTLTDGSSMHLHSHG
eukprot:TRINITY_DN7708_c0_g1_i1.p1 TRINITY_DN7708_c0_g1~~TRINITY_DN7708_c0_g1_i1.p1  ORF type:complete len:364 (-),score=97.11 TRINITY_DN7708_c0_g1_i1:594-1685(-)